MKYVIFFLFCEVILFDTCIAEGVDRDVKSISTNRNEVNNKNSNRHKGKTPWTEQSQSYPDLQKSDAILPGDVAAEGDPNQKYDNPLKPPKWMMLKKMEPPGLPETPPPPPPEQPAPMATPDFSAWGGAGWNGYMPRTMNNRGSLNYNVHLLAQGVHQPYAVGLTPTNTLNAYYGSFLEINNNNKDDNPKLRGGVGYSRRE